MKTFKQFLEYTQTASEYEMEVKAEREKKKDMAKMKDEITADVMSRVNRKNKITQNTPNPYAN